MWVTVRANLQWILPGTLLTGVKCNFTVFYCVSPFTVEPMEGSLGVGEYMQLNVDFEPKKVGDHTGNLTVSYNTGESQQEFNQ